MEGASHPKSQTNETSSRLQRHIPCLSGPSSSSVTQKPTVIDLYGELKKSNSLLCALQLCSSFLIGYSAEIPSTSAKHRANNNKTSTAIRRDMLSRRKHMLNHSCITEDSNMITENIDICSDAASLLRLLRQTDAQLFTGFDVHPSLMDIDFVEAVESAVEAWQHPEGMVVVAGAGASGNMASFVCTRLSVLAERLGATGRTAYLVAGGDEAILRVGEASAEDKAQRAVSDLEPLLQKFRGGVVCYIGVSCSLSAVYVGAQLEHIMNKQEAHSEQGRSGQIHATLIGFNPPSAVRPVQVSGWTTTAKANLDRFLTSAGVHGVRRTFVNPVVGPEAVAGSSRMKGGTATLLLLEAILGVGLHIATGAQWLGTDVLRKGCTSRALMRSAVRDFFLEALNAVSRLYHDVDALGGIVERASEAIKMGRRVVYVGRGSGGFLGVLDAAECPPTYSSSWQELRGYIHGGWTALGTHEGDLWGTQGQVGGDNIEVGGDGGMHSLYIDTEGLLAADSIVSGGGLERGDLLVVVEIEDADERCKAHRLSLNNRERT